MRSVFSVVKHDCEAFRRVSEHAGS